MKRKKFTVLQIVTSIFIILYVVWEWNMQIYLVDHSLDYAIETRYDLMFILPSLVLLIGISLWQYFKERD